MTDDNEFILITGQGCPACGQAKEMLKDKIESGRVKVLDLMKDDEALNLIQKHDIRGVPKIILKDKVTGFTESCDLSADCKTALCKDKKVEL